MILLAVEQASARGSIAVLRDRDTLAEASWADERLRNQHLFAVLPGLLTEAGVSPEGIEAYAVDVGPGSYSGLRIAIAAVEGLALPDPRPICAITTGEVLAWQIAEAHHLENTRVWVVGDARRGHVWRACFMPVADGVDPVEEYALMTPDSLAAGMAAGDVVVTPDAARIGPQIESRLPTGVTLVRDALSPTAVALGRVALCGLLRGTPPRALSPIYLHPPVTVEPRFTAAP